MPIRVTCTKCMARFNVSEKFAGREGPCPKCQTVIRIPKPSEEVVVHAPETSGPTDTKGRPVLKPLRRNETVLTPVQIVLIAVTIIGFLIGALLLRTAFPDPATIPLWLLPAILTGLAPACVLGAYTFLRDQEAGAFQGRTLLVRVLITSAVYAVSWVAMWLAAFAFDNNYGPASWLTASVVMLGIGGLAATLVLELDWWMGLVHYGLYYGASLLLRLCSGAGPFPNDATSAPPVPVPPTPGLPDPAVPFAPPLGMLWESLGDCLAMMLIMRIPGT